jgi:Peptidase A4 family
MTPKVSVAAMINDARVFRTVRNAAIDRPLRVGLAVALAAAAAVAAVVGLAIDGGGGRKRQVVKTRAFAGYLWDGRVTAVSATWDVPRLDHNTLGFACTWIGAESGGTPGPFIQVGVAESHLIPKGDEKLGFPNAAFAVRAYAFWSDTRHHFHILPIAPVSPGDTVKASLTLAGVRWHVRLTDSRSLLKVHFSTRDEAQPLLTAEWMQEDATNPKTNGLYAYPRLSAIRFRNLGVDRAPPSQAALTAQSMSPSPERTIVPGPVNHDAFTIPAGA